MKLFKPCFEWKYFEKIKDKIIKETTYDLELKNYAKLNQIDKRDSETDAKRFL
jgi:hypothetical protein